MELFFADNQGCKKSAAMTTTNFRRSDKKCAMPILFTIIMVRIGKSWLVIPLAHREQMTLVQSSNGLFFIIGNMTT